MFLSLLLSGSLTTKHFCHEFDCKLLKRFQNQKCEIQWVNGKATTFGMTFEMHQFMYGAKDGFHGTSGGNALTVFFVNNQPATAYISSYYNRSDYDRWMCEFKKKPQR